MKSFGFTNSQHLIMINTGKDDSPKNDWLTLWEKYLAIFFVAISKISNNKLGLMSDKLMVPNF